MLSPFLQKMRAAARQGFNAANGNSTPLTAATKTLLEKAAWDQDTAVVRSLITRWPELANHAAADGLTPLHCAAASMDHAQVEWLLAQGARTDACDNNGNTPLHYAAQASFAHCTDILIRAQADIDVCNNMGQTPLYFAVMYERPENLHLLIAAGAKDNTVCSAGETPRSLAPKEDKKPPGGRPPPEALPPGTIRPDMLRALNDAQQERKQAFENAPVLGRDMTITSSPAVRKRNARKP